jgi:hypothetical protein
MKNAFRVLSVAVALAMGAAAADVAPTPDLPLVANGDLRLNTSDFIAYTQIIPEENRIGFLTSFEKITRTVDGLWVRRMLAEKARRAGLDADPEVQRRIQQSVDSILADRYIEREVVAKIKLPNLEARALEIYKADPKRFTLGEMVNLQHIMVNLQGRTREEAAARAAEAYDQATKGSKNFLDYARLYSDDPELSKNFGDLGYKSPGSFTASAWSVVGKMKPGEISKPLATERGFFIFKLVDRRPERRRTFEEVKDKIIADEAQKIVDAQKEEAIEAVRKDKGNLVYMDNIRKLQVQVDMKSLPTVQGEVR